MAAGKITIVRSGPKAIGAHVPAITKKAFERFGFPQAALLTDWEAIVGQDLARFTEPERLKWPRLDDAASADEAEAATGKSGRSRPAAKGLAGATLVLRVDGPLAIEVQHKSAQIIERINGYFGFRAVTDLRILQAPLSRKPAAVPASRKPPSDSALPAGASPLEHALERLERHVEAQRKTDCGSS